MDKQSKWKKIIIAANILSVLAIISIILLHSLTEKTTVQKEPVAIADMPISKIAIDKHEIPTREEELIGSMTLNDENEEMKEKVEKDTIEEITTVAEEVVDDQTEETNYEENQYTWSSNQSSGSITPPSKPVSPSKPTKPSSSNTSSEQSSPEKSPEVDTPQLEEEVVHENQEVEESDPKDTEKEVPVQETDQSCKQGSESTNCGGDKEEPIDNKPVCAEPTDDKECDKESQNFETGKQKTPENKGD